MVKLKTIGIKASVAVAVLMAACGSAFAQDNAANILTPPAPSEPRINGPTVFGVRPGSPFLYTIPATGDRPMEFAVEGLPKGLTVDAATGRITGELAEKGELKIVLKARNAKGSAEKKFRIIAGDQICLTPHMGWASWNCCASSVDQDKVLRAAGKMVSSGLINHGWTYINIDDGWQGKRDGKFNGLQGNEKFPDMQSLCDEIHKLGLKAGIYSTPFISSYAGFLGGSSDDPSGNKKESGRQGQRFGKFSFAENDAKQWAAWGFDCLKYDWFPIDVEHVSEMSKALRACKRDIVFALSNTGSLQYAADYAKWANCWRVFGDLDDTWNSVNIEAFNFQGWAPFAGPGHWNDPDMLVLGYVGWGKPVHMTRLTPDEQYTHISMWCMRSAPLLLGCDMDRLDPFTLSLLSNDEVLAVDQDALGKQAICVAKFGPLGTVAKFGTIGVELYAKNLENGSKVFGFFNRTDQVETINFSEQLSEQLRSMPGPVRARDLWRQKDLGIVARGMQAAVNPHGVVLIQVTPAK